MLSPADGPAWSARLPETRHDRGGQVIVPAFIAGWLELLGPLMAVGVLDIAIALAAGTLGRRAALRGAMVTAWSVGTATSRERSARDRLGPGCATSPRGDVAEDGRILIRGTLADITKQKIAQLAPPRPRRRRQDRHVFRRGCGRRGGPGHRDPILHLAHRMGLTVVAEGVETLEQADVLSGLGFELLQGHALGRPAEALPAGPQLQSTAR